ncbi:MAG: hypothetical protein KDA81_21875, partial [Planctomycetaceae bacterium]|nr:hypothetical protein [Planctomycetaceae bacterium]
MGLFRAGHRRRRRNAPLQHASAEVMEVRLLLTGTTDSPDEMTDSTMLEESSSDIDAAMSEFDYDTSFLYEEPDYESFVENSPLAGIADTSTPDAMSDEMAEYDQMMEAAQQEAASSTDFGTFTAETSSQDGTYDGESYQTYEDYFDQETSGSEGDDDSWTLADYVNEFTGNESAETEPETDSESSGDSSSTDDGESSNSEYSNTESSGSQTTSGSTGASTGETTTSSSDGNGADGDGSTTDSDSVPADPRLDWNPMELPEGVTFSDSSFAGYSFLNDPFSVTPDGTGSFENVQTTVTDFDPEATDPELGAGERLRKVTTTMKTKQDYVSEDDWTVTYTLTNRYDDDEESTDSDDVDT